MFCGNAFSRVVQLFVVEFLDQPISVVVVFLQKAVSCDYKVGNIENVMIGMGVAKLLYIV